MEKILLGLTVFFFTATSLFYFFLTRFNESNKNQSDLNNIAGVKTEKKVMLQPTDLPTFFPTKADISPTPESTPQTSMVTVPIGALQIDGKTISIVAIKEYPKDAIPTNPVATKNLPFVPFADFSLEIKFPGKILPGSSNNKFISQNKEYEVKLFSQIGTEEGFNRQNFFAEKTGTEIQMLLYKINDNSIIINRETGWWEGGAQVAIGVTDSNELNEKNVVRFFIE